MEVVHKAVVAYAAHKKLQEMKKQKRKCWVQKKFLSRNQAGFFAVMYPKIKCNPDKFFAYTRMKAPAFQMLLSILQDKLQKRSIRRPISAECRLFITLMYLAHGGARSIYSSRFRIGVTTIRRIIMDTCKIIWEELSAIYVKPPTTDEYLAIADTYERNKRIPNCIGAIGAKHIRITCPPHSGSNHYNNKDTLSIVLLAVCNTDHLITNFDVIADGSVSNGGNFFRKSKFGKMLLERRLLLPKDSALKNWTTRIPYYFIGDYTFPLTKHIMRPFPGRDLTLDKQHFNKILSRAKLTIENTFGVMASRWRLLLKSIKASPGNAGVIVKAIVALHNFSKLNSADYSPPEYADRIINDQVLPGQWRSNTNPLISLTQPAANRSSSEAFNNRETLCAYLNSSFCISEREKY